VVIPQMLATQIGCGRVHVNSSACEVPMGLKAARVTCGISVRLRQESDAGMLGDRLISDTVTGARLSGGKSTRRRRSCFLSWFHHEA
jgi:hypothetical protein